MTESDIKVYWYYFRSLATQLKQTEQYVDHSLNVSGTMQNGSVFSNEFAKILMLAASEFEVIAKALCAESGKALSWNASIITITKTIKSTFPNIGMTSVSTPYYTLQPLKDWKIIKVKNKTGGSVDSVNGIPWWQNHNGVKHDRINDFQKATLKNCIDSLASLMVLELYLSQKAIGNIDAISIIGCDYFDCDYGLSHMVVNAGNKLPDFH